MAARDGGLQIPNKLYFRIGEVSEITGVQPYTLRHWEMEFPTLSPKKNDSGQRLYRKEDIEMVHTIQRLLHSEGYTTAGARRLLSAKSGKRARPVVPKPPPPPKPEPATVSPEALKEARAALDLMDANDKRLAALEE
ncbi:MAG: MerR family transcriptional regulator [Acidobacteria bacterium]|nr:MerR family transcriptional regulator [Acidobacteriota bacterium]